MDYKDIDYSKYLSVDNGRGILLSKGDIEILERYGFDFRNYSSIKNLLIDLDSYCNDNLIDEDLEDVINKISEMYYYNCVNK